MINRLVSPIVKLFALILTPIVVFISPDGWNRRSLLWAGVGTVAGVSMTLTALVEVASAYSVLPSTFSTRAMMIEAGFYLLTTLALWVEASIAIILASTIDVPYKPDKK